MKVYNYLEIKSRYINFQTSMSSDSYTPEQNERIDEWLTLASQDNIKPGTESFKHLLALMADDDQIVIDTVTQAIQDQFSSNNSDN